MPGNGAGGVGMSGKEFHYRTVNVSNLKRIENIHFNFRKYRRYNLDKEIGFQVVAGLEDHKGATSTQFTPPPPAACQNLIPTGKA